MAVYRVAKKKSLMGKQRSFCDYCGKQLRWFDNIPVVSWILLRGRTKCCHKKLSVLYPIVELGTGILYLLIGQNWLGLAVGSVLVFLMVFDGKYLLLPDGALYLMLVLGIIGGYKNWMAGLVFGLVFWLLTKIKIRGQEAMGNGDPYLAVFMGLWLGWWAGLAALYVAFIAGAIVGVILIKLKAIKRVDPLPFGPFLIGGTFVSWFFWPNILYYVNRWF